MGEDPNSSSSRNHWWWLRELTQDAAPAGGWLGSWGDSEGFQEMLCLRLNQLFPQSPWANPGWRKNAPPRLATHRTGLSCGQR